MLVVKLREAMDPRVCRFATHVARIFGSVQRKRSLQGLQIVLDTSIEKPMQGFGLGHDARALRLDVKYVRMAPQEFEHPTHWFLALARAQIIDDTDSQFGCVLFVAEA